MFLPVLDREFFILALTCIANERALQIMLHRAIYVLMHFVVDPQSAVA
jgi:hypothetical protein